MPLFIYLLLTIGIEAPMLFDPKVGFTVLLRYALKLELSKSLFVAGFVNCSIYVTRST